MAYYLQANGIVERGHKQLGDRLSKACSQHPVKWPNYLTAIVWADRTTVKKSTGYSPFQLVYGRQYLLPIELLLSSWQQLRERPTATKADLLALRVEQLTMATKDVEQAVKNLEKSRLAGKTCFDKKKRLQPETSKIHKGDLVLVHDYRLDKQHTEKLADR